MASSDFQIINSDTLDILGMVGRGAFGVVYLANHKDWETKVAVKICDSTPSNVSINQSIFDEARKISRANHKYIIRLYGITEATGLCGLVMEYMENGSLERLLRDLKSAVNIPWPLRWRFLAELCTGMNILHNLSPAKVFHLDLKPGNILLDEHLSVKITDFGLSKIRTSQSAGKVAGGPGGTVTHYPPEYFDQINLPVTEKFDVYSFGIVIWEIITREQVYKHAINSAQIETGVKCNNRPDLKEIPSDIPDDMKTDLLPLMKQCWDQDPKERPYFKDMLEFFNTKCTSCRGEIFQAVADVHKDLEDAGKKEIELCNKFKNVLRLDGAVSHTRSTFGALSKVPTQATAETEGDDKDDMDTADSTVHPPIQAVSNVGSNQSPGGNVNPSGNYRYVYVSEQPQYQQQQQQQQQMPQFMQPQYMQPPIAYAQNVYNIQDASQVMIGGPGTRQDTRYPNAPIASPVAERAQPKEPTATVAPKTLLRISKNIGPKWKELGRWLQFTDPQIDTIEIDHHHYGVQEQAYQMLYRWHQKKGRAATHSILAEALNDIERPDLVSHL